MPRTPSVEPSSAPRTLGPTAASRPDDFRRRREPKNCNSGGGGAGSAMMGDTSTQTRRGHRQEQRRPATSATAPAPAPSSAGAQNSGPDSRTSRKATASVDSRSRNPLSRYLLLSGVLVAAGLVVRYLWRQLAGLVGAVLILSTARHWSGDSPSAGDAPHDDEPPRRGTGRTRKQSREPSAPAAGGDTGASEGRSSGVGAATGGGGAGDVVGRGVTGFAVAPAELRRYWEDGGPECQFLVRGPTYLSDRKKIPAGPAAMRLVHVDFFAVEGEVFHVASKGRCRDRVTGFLKEFEDRGEKAPFLFILNILVPGNPIVATVMYLALDAAGMEGQQQEQTGGGGGGEGGGEGTSSSKDDTFLRMLERYAEVPGSGYKKLERARSSSPPPTPPPLPAPADFALSAPSEASIPSTSSSPASSASFPSAAAAAASSAPPTPSPPPPQHRHQEAPASPNLSQMLRSGAESSLAPPREPSPRNGNGGRNGKGGGNGGDNGGGSGSGSGDFIVGRDVGASFTPGGFAGSPPMRGSPMGSNASAKSSRDNNNNNNNNNGSVPAVGLPGRFSDPVGLLPADDFRNQRFKLIPSVVSGPFIVRKAVGNKPALLGRKVSQRYFRGPGYVETDVDVGSSMIAEKIVSLCRGYAKSLTVELGICLEGRCDEELPEKVIGVIRLVNLDVSKAEPLLDAGSGIDRSNSTNSSAASSSDRALSSSSGKSSPSTGGRQGAGQA